MHTKSIGTAASLLPRVGGGGSAVPMLLPLWCAEVLASRRR
ncbi:hypothetical protein [Corynebacterium tuberculostearicum]|uniref:Uncharacterized protein n=1 Tax=Corynebacterium tuberculostearicum SK141 TaxID=553206 RepID=C6R7Q8_9CORY|nr:hypothetical protein [Corynebacterium tuberculostearicum]EET78028.1 hypothetical protein CORTU0001_0952 [Corynebacterium tuberculostearicum SK141]